MKLLDLRTLQCPQPVIQCRQTLTQEDISQIQILVDNDAAVENVSRYLAQQGFTVQNTKQGNDFSISAQRDGNFPTKNTSENTSSITKNAEEQSIAIFITTQHLGHGDGELGEKLMATFLSTLPELGKSLWRIIFLNGGVKLAAQNGPALKTLQELEQNGVNILVCGTCLAHYGLEKQVGETSNMLDIVTSLHLADKVIRP